MTKAAETMENNESAAGWTQATLGDFLATRTRGIVPNKTPDTTFELYSVPSLDSGTPEIVTGGEIGSNKKIVDEGTVLLCKINPRINRAWVVLSHTAHQKIASTEWITFPPNESFEPKYLAYYLKQDAVRDFLATNASGVGGSLMRVKPATLKDYPFPLAPLDQQKRIVTEIEKQFSRLDEAVANLKRVKANLKRYKAAVLKAAVEGRLVETEAELARREGRSYATGEQLLQRILATRRSQWKGKGKYKEPAAPDATDLPEIPEGWVWATYEQVGRLQLGRQRAPKYHSGQNMKPYLRVQNVFEDRIDLSDVMEMDFPPNDFAKFELKTGDLLLNEGQSPELLGRPAIYRGELPGVCFTNTLIRFKAAEGVSVEFALIVSRHYMHAGRFVDEATITTNIAHLSVGRLAMVEFPLPPAIEQLCIVAEVDRLFSLVRKTEIQVDANLQRAERLRQSILASAFSG